MKTFYITTPIYYPNARPHVGSAYTTIVCDVIARYKRMCGYDVAFLTGTDEHGEKLERAAAEAGVPPAQFVAEKRELFRELWRFLNISDYRFVHTSQNPDHVRSVQWMLQQARKNGYIEKKKYEGRYCVFDERYVSDNGDPVNCDICGRPAELISEENYFFKLKEFEQPLLELYDRHLGAPGRTPFVQPEYRLNEVKSFVKSGLRDISVSRKRLKWGIPWPDDPDQVFYVWYDALTSYMTGIGFGSQDPARKAQFQKYWRNHPGESEIVHMIGKDILRFHAVYWPAFIMAAYPDQPEILPTTVFAHGWIYYEQDKMSKSKGNVVYPEPIIDTLDSFGAPGNDTLRYYLLRETPFGQDTSFSYDGLIQRYNSDLANDLGNLANRTLTMLNRDYAGSVPQVQFGTSVEEILGGEPPEKEIAELAKETVKNYQSCLESFNFSQGLDTAWRFIARLNQYLNEQEPWTKLRRLEQSKGQYVTTEPKHLQAVLYTSAAALRFLAVLLYPVMPHACQKLWGQLGQRGPIIDQNLPSIRFEDLKSGTQVAKPEPIFPRLDKAKTLAKLHELAEADYDRDKSKEALKSVETESPKTPKSQTPRAEPRPSSPSPDQKISIEDFAKVDMRVGEVKSAERVEGAQKLLKVMVDIGSEIRQVVAGIAEYYQPAHLIGTKIILVANLQPRKLRGVESDGMLLAATVGEEGRPVLVTFKEDVPNGARLK